MLHTNSICYAELSGRGFIGLSGPDSKSFLQNLVTNDVMTVTPDKAVYAALLTPQGRFLHDMIIMEMPDGSLLLDCEAERRQDLIKRLKLYKLRAKVDITDLTDQYGVIAVFESLVCHPRGSGNPESASAGLITLTNCEQPKLDPSFRWGDNLDFNLKAVPDPRTPLLGFRLIAQRSHLEKARDILKAQGFIQADENQYDLHRIRLGVPDGSRDMSPEKALPMENNMDELNAISWTKGCYVGQELTARMKYRGLVRKKLVYIQGNAPLPPFGTPIMQGDQEVGELRTSIGNEGLALIRIEELLNSAILTADEVLITPNEI